MISIALFFSVNFPASCRPNSTASLHFSWQGSPWDSWEMAGPWAGPYRSIPWSVMRYWDSAMPLGDHLTTATKQNKILEGEYVDFFNLLFCKVEKKNKEDLEDKDKGWLKKQKLDRTWANWLLGYFIYAGLLVHHQPQKATALFQYVDIYRTYRDFVRSTWIIRRVITRIVVTYCNVSLELLVPRVLQNSHFRFSCYIEYINQVVCARKTCKYKHKCTLCAFSHVSSACPKGKPKEGTQD